MNLTELKQYVVDGATQVALLSGMLFGDKPLNVIIALIAVVFGIVGVVLRINRNKVAKLEREKLELEIENLKKVNSE